MSVLKTFKAVVIRDIKTNGPLTRSLTVRPILLFYFPFPISATTGKYNIEFARNSGRKK